MEKQKMLSSSFSSSSTFSTSFSSLPMTFRTLDPLQFENVCLPFQCFYFIFGSGADGCGQSSGLFPYEPL